MGRRLEAWRALSFGDRIRLAICAAILPGIHAALALCGYRRTRRLIELLTWRARRHAATPAQQESARTLARLAAIAGRHGLVTATCLRQSLLVYGWLRMRGFDPAIRIGVQRITSSLDAHAWVELEHSSLEQAEHLHSRFAIS